MVNDDLLFSLFVQVDVDVESISNDFDEDVNNVSSVAVSGEEFLNSGEEIFIIVMPIHVQMSKILEMSCCDVDELAYGIHFPMILLQACQH